MAATKNAPAPRPAAAPAEKPTDFLALLERSRGEIAKLMPTERAADRVMRIARTAFQMNADIRRCTPGSILAAVMKACELNLEPGGALRHAWLVPYGPECTFQVSNFGMLELARRSGAFRAIEARVVRPGDVFQVAYDPEPVFRHVPDLDAAAVADDGQILHAYAYARLANGALVLEVMSRAEIERVRQAAKCGPVWQKHWGEMAKKTVIKRLLKRQPCSVELAEAIEHDNQEYDLGDVTPRPGALPARGAAGLAGRLGAPPAPEPEPEFAAGEGVSRPVYSEDDDTQALAESVAQDRAEGT
jgi:recombination protein RecT